MTILRRTGSRCLAVPLCLVGVDVASPKQNFHNSLVPAASSWQEWCLTVITCLVGANVAPPEQRFHHPLVLIPGSPRKGCITHAVFFCLISQPPTSSKQATIYPKDGCTVQDVEKGEFVETNTVSTRFLRCEGILVDNMSLLQKPENF